MFRSVVSLRIGEHWLVTGHKRLRAIISVAALQSALRWLLLARLYAPVGIARRGSGLKPSAQTVNFNRFQ